MVATSRSPSANRTRTGCVAPIQCGSQSIPTTLEVGISDWFFPEYSVEQFLYACFGEQRPRMYDRCSLSGVHQLRGRIRGDNREKTK